MGADHIPNTLTLKSRNSDWRAQQAAPAVQGSTTSSVPVTVDFYGGKGGDLRGERSGKNGRRRVSREIR